MVRYRILLVVLALILGACGTVATPVFQEDLQNTQVAQAATSAAETASAPTLTPTFTPSPTPTVTDTPTSTPTVTPVPPTDTPVPTDTPAPTEPPTAAASGAAAGDPAHGQEIFNTFYPEANFACATCHRVDSEEQLIGPGLLNVGERAASRVPGESAEEYIYTSIVKPSAFVVPGYPDNLMPKNWQEILSEQDIQDVIAYLMTLKG